MKEHCSGYTKTEGRHEVRNRRKIEENSALRWTHHNKRSVIRRTMKFSKFQKKMEDRSYYETEGNPDEQITISSLEI